MFAANPSPETAQAAARTLTKPDYTASPSGLGDNIVAFFIGFILGFVVTYVFYAHVVISLAGGAVTGAVYIFIAAHGAIRKRKRALRLQFFDLLEALSVAMRAGNPVATALQSARADLLLLHPESSDIVVELDIISANFANGVPLSRAFMDFAERSELEDIASFASIYETIEGKSGRADEIVRQTQSIIADKMEIEMEMETLMSGAKNEMNVMTLMPLIILLVIKYAGAGFMDTLYTTAIGRVVATVGLAIFVIAFAMGRKISSISL
ncbi:MAG: type II secretion system F family protein [Oscillospiraceae bacterium]|jgi:tight adherence protein B|nr:type II secretion system F family protein [Oscillospiraceae bacterium]